MKALLVEEKGKKEEIESRLGIEITEAKEKIKAFNDENTALRQKVGTCPKQMMEKHVY